MRACQHDDAMTLWVSLRSTLPTGSLGRTTDLTPDNLRQLRRWGRVAAAVGADDAVDDGHADAGEVAELHAVEEVLAGGMLRSVHDDEIRRATDFDNAAVQRAHPRGVAGRKAKCDFRRHLAER